MVEKYRFFFLVKFKLPTFFFHLFCAHIDPFNITHELCGTGLMKNKTFETSKQQTSGHQQEKVRQSSYNLPTIFVQSSYNLIKIFLNLLTIKSYNQILQSSYNLLTAFLQYLRHNFHIPSLRLVFFQLVRTRSEICSTHLRAVKFNVFTKLFGFCFNFLEMLGCFPLVPYLLWLSENFRRLLYGLWFRSSSLHSGHIYRCSYPPPSSHQ